MGRKIVIKKINYQFYQIHFDGYYLTEMRKKENLIISERYHVIDMLRGMAILNMVIYHGIWDIVYLFGFNWSWYQSKGVYIWQQFICWTFILISGFCYSFSRQKLKRGLHILILGMLISVFTSFVIPENSIRFGILTLIGSCMLLIIPIENLLSKVYPIKGICICLLLFILTKNINRGFLGFEMWNIVKIPNILYSNMASTYLGFPMSGFHSTDYFPLIPWSFLFITGYFLNRELKQRNLLQYLKPRKNFLLEFLGRHSLFIYVTHQPVLYICIYFLTLIRILD